MYQTDSELKLDIITETESKAWRAAEALWASSFPIEERRDCSRQHELITAEPAFRPLRISYKGDFAGILFWWDLNQIAYCEHFAIMPNFRNAGLGTNSLKLLRQQVSKKILLEVETPDTPLAARRLGFYLRSGFEILDPNYRQPPYHPQFPELPMYLLGTAPMLPPELAHAIETIHRRVYQKFAC